MVEIKGSKPSGSEDYVTLDETSSVVEAKLTINGYEIEIKDKEIVSITPGDSDADNGGNSGEDNKENEDMSVLSGKVVKAGKPLQLITNLKENDSIYSVEWTSSDENIATVDSMGIVTAKKTGNVTITATTSGGKKATYSIISVGLLSGEVKVGDYVAYDVSPAGKGWRVLSVNKDTNTVTIVHAGSPENYTHGTDSSASVTNLNNIAQKYKDDAYADSAHNMNYNEANAISQSDSLRNIGSVYWLAGLYSSSILWVVYSDGSLDHSNNSAYGVRPVVVLKSNIKTMGKVKDTVGHDAWSLVKP